ncbi:MAG: insulysin [Pseudomonadales bacterium]
MLLSRLANRDYTTSQLKNELEYTLIKCPSAPKASIAVSIAMGHFSDPDDCQGLSHLMEHMVFAGSKNYPDGNYLNQLLNTHGGFVNAWTSAETCNFHFDCPAAQFLESLDVLLDMLTQPELKLAGIDREVDAIDAEFSLRKQDDVRRLYDVHKQTCNQDHPFSRFSVGNKDIFQQYSAQELQKKLIAHHLKYFSASNIKICILLPDTDKQESLISLIEQKLLALKTQKEAISKLPLPKLYLPHQKVCLIEVKPYKFAQNLILTFCLPSIVSWSRSKPLLLLCHLIEDASENSLQHYLKQEGLILEITASGGIEGSNFQDVNINLRLTDKGLHHTQKLIQITMHWFALLRKNGIEKWRFDEKAQQLELQVKHAQLPSGIDEVVMLSTRMHKYSLQQALEYDVVMDTYDTDVFERFLGYFISDNLRVFCINPAAKCDQKTTQYEVPFSVHTLAISQTQSSQFELVLPAQNPYMSDNFDLVDKELDSTEIVTIQSAEFLLKFTQNQEFKTPKGDCYLSIENPNMIGSAVNSAIKKLWIACLTEQLNEAYSGAEMAGLNFRLYGHQGGMTLHTSGFSHSQLMLCEEILKFIQNVNIKPAIFIAVKEKMATSLKNTLLNKPINQLFSDLNIVLKQNTFSEESMLRQVQRLELPELQNKVSSYFDKTHIEGLAVGNWNRNQIYAFHRSVIRCFKNMDTLQKSSRNIAHIAYQRIGVQHKQSHDEHAAVVYFQSPDNSNLNKGLYVAIEKLLSPIIFDELRNKRNLAYLVGCGYFPVNKRPGLAIYIQSPSQHSDILYQAICDVLNDFISNIDDFEPIFDNFKQSLIKQFHIIDGNTNQLAQRLWMDFDELADSTQRNEMSEVINDLTFECFKVGCKSLLQDSKIGKAIFVTRPLVDIQKSFAGFDFIDDTSQFISNLKYQ